MTADSPPQNILVIKLSALGDFILSIGAFQAIRAHHPQARIALLTTKPFARLAEASGCFDEIWIDERPPVRRPGRWLALGRRLRRAGFDRVYDLQRSDRTAGYFYLAGRPQWVGTVAGCSHRYRLPPEPLPHIALREADQLAGAGVAPIEAPDLSFLEADIGRFDLTAPCALLVPGAAPHRPAKRWPAARFAALAREL
ncbi:MAG: glycosyltransferase family 9 protein, partial [Proteobacteria bacterium]|nr:glycosyltransferase family 9 protein [Pseudomonadota bacterium]